MSASHAPALDAVVLQLAAAVDSYEAEVAAMLAAWPDLERYGIVSNRIEDIRRLAAALPTLSAQWVELLIAHAELVHCLWRMQHGQPAVHAEGLPPLRAHHADCIGALRCACHRLAQGGRMRPVPAAYSGSGR